MGYPIDTDDVRLIDKKRLSVGITPLTISSTALQAFSAAASSGSLSSVTEATDMSCHELNLFIARSISPLTISSTALQAFSAAASSGSRSSVLNLDSTHAARS